MLKTKAKEYYVGQSMNCAESVFRAAGDYFGFTITPEESAMVRGFGGGMGCGDTCGALVGAVNAMGRLYKADNTDKKPVELSAQLVEKFTALAGGTLCAELKPRHVAEGVRCYATVCFACDALEAVADTNGLGKAKECTVPAAEIKRVKGMGFLNNKGTNNFNCRVITRNGHITSEENACIAEAAKRFGSGSVAFTTRLTVEIQGVPFENIEPIREFLATAGLETGGTGSKVRPVVSCKGTTCQYGLIDTFDLSEKLHYIFYKGYQSVTLPHKFKIAVGGCPNNCVKPSLNDIGIFGQRIATVDVEKCKSCKKCAVENGCPIKACHTVDGKLVIDESECNRCGRCVAMCPFGAVTGETYGYRIVIGGRWGKKIAIGQELDHIFTNEDDVISTVEKAILLFREQGKTGERFSDTIARLGFENVQKQLLSDDILNRKDKIIGEMEVVGGASC